MGFLQITFNDPINVSCDVGDDVYATTTISQDSANTLFLGSMSNLTHLGTVYSVVNGDGLDPSSLIYLIVDYGSGTPPFLPTINVTTGSFIMFSKNKQANTSGITGYYAEAKMVNNSKTEAELFAVGSSVAISSQ